MWSQRVHLPLRDNITPYDQRKFPCIVVLYKSPSTVLSCKCAAIKNKCLITRSTPSITRGTCLIHIDRALVHIEEMYLSCICKLLLLLLLLRAQVVLFSDNHNTHKHTIVGDTNEPPLSSFQDLKQNTETGLKNKTWSRLRQHLI